VDSNGRTIWIADAHRDNGKRFVVHVDEKLTAFLEFESQLVAKGMLSRKTRVSRSYPDVRLRSYRQRVSGALLLLLLLPPTVWGQQISESNNERK
jgi:hypothetical protein